jgi:hypothetical protein
MPSEKTPLIKVEFQILELEIRSVAYLKYCEEDYGRRKSGPEDYVINV